MMILPSRGKLFLVLFLVPMSLLCQSRRPAVLQEQKTGSLINFLKGIYIGYEDLVSFMGWYESDEVKQGIEEESLEIDPADEEDQTTIKIVGLGLGRTGTTSVATALEILGYSVVHDDEQPELTDLFYFEAEEEIDLDEFHEVLGLRGYNATFKTADFEWVSKHDDVKAILTVRDNPEMYAESWLRAAPFIQILRSAPYRWMPTVENLLPSLEAEYVMITTGGRPEDFLNKTVLMDSYESYVQAIQTAIPADRLLIFNVKQGWEPLCDYLDVPVPEGIPFPHVNTRARLEGEMWFLWLTTWIWPLVVPIALAVLHVVHRVARRIFKMII